MATVRELLTLFSFKTDRGGAKQAETAVNAIKSAADRAAGSFTEMNQKLQLMRQGLAAVRNVAGKAFKTIITDFANSTDEAAKTARAVGVTVGELQELNFAAQLSGASNADVTKSLGQLAKAGREASKGTKTFKEAFDDLGIVTTDNQGKLKSTRALLGDVADSFKKMKDGSEKTAISMKLFGRTGAKLIPFLSEGREGLNKMAIEARRLGIVIGPQGAKKAEKFNDEMLRAKSALLGLRNTIALKLIPALTSGLTRFVAWITEGDRVQRILGVMKKAARIAGIALTALVSVKVIGLVVAFGAALTAGLAPLAIMAAKFIILGAIAQDVFKLFTGEGSKLAGVLSSKDIDEFKKAFLEIGKAGKDIFKALVPLIKEIVVAIKPLVPFLLQLIRLVAKGLVVALKVVKAIIVVMATVIKKVAIEFKKLGPVFRALTKTIKTLWNNTIGLIISKIGQLTDKMGGLKTIAKAIAFVFGGMVKVIGVIAKAIAGTIGLVGSVVKGLANALGLRNRLRFQTRARRVDLPLPPAAGAGAGQPQGAQLNDSSVTNIAVNVPPGASTDEIAARVGNEVNERQAAARRQMMRNLRSR